MKIAATYLNGEIFQHFGHSEFFKIYQAENGEIKSGEVISAEGFGHGALAGFLKERGVEALVCGGIGGGAVSALAQAGIKVYAGASGSADDCVAALLSGTLEFSGEANCSHHAHEHGEHGGHDCSHGGHDCGHGGCGHR